MGIRVVYGPAPALAGQAALLAGLGDYRKWLFEQQQQQNAQRGSEAIRWAQLQQEQDNAEAQRSFTAERDQFQADQQVNRDTWNATTDLEKMKLQQDFTEDQRLRSQEFQGEQPMRQQRAEEWQYTEQQQHKLNQLAEYEATINQQVSSGELSQADGRAALQTLQAHRAGIAPQAMPWLKQAARPEGTREGDVGVLTDADGNDVPYKIINGKAVFPPQRKQDNTAGKLEEKRNEFILKQTQALFQADQDTGTPRYESVTDALDDAAALYDTLARRKAKARNAARMNEADSKAYDQWQAGQTQQPGQPPPPAPSAPIDAAAPQQPLPPPPSPERPVLPAAPQPTAAEADARTRAWNEATAHGLEGWERQEYVLERLRNPAFVGGGAMPQQPAPSFVQLALPGEAQAPAAPPQTQTVRIQNDAEWKALPPGTRFIGPDGILRVK